MGQLVLLLVAAGFTYSAKAENLILNNPYPQEYASENIYFTSFSEQPKTLDPARSYTAEESQFTAQIYEPVVQYDYLKRPYTLVPSTAETMPTVQYFDAEGREVFEPTKEPVATSLYTIKIQPGIYYQPHPAFARDSQGNFYYYPLEPKFLESHDIKRLTDFTNTGTRELYADDYIYEIKRLANPRVNSPIFGFMSSYIKGFKEYGKSLPKSEAFIDLRAFPLEGVRKINDYTYEIIINGYYPQFIYWLAMPFFSPVPWEVERFYSQPGMRQRNISMNWYPVGTGPYMLMDNNPNRRMLLVKNPNYTPSKNRIKPQVDQALFTLEKETLPRWNKFLQGYYDGSWISPESFDQTIHITSRGGVTLTKAMQDKGIKLTETDDISVGYLGFNMLDPIVGGTSDRARFLRQAISNAINFEEYIAIFLDGRGTVAHGPIPPGIFGNDGSKYARLPLSKAKELMRKAGYPGGKDPATGKPLILHYDVAVSGSPEDMERLNWMRKQFAKLGIELDIRATQYNRFQEKMRNGNAQIYSWGWNADYPDPENFLILLYGPNGKVKYGGENASNYQNSEYDNLFLQMKNYPNNSVRKQLIDQMLTILNNDAPWVWGVNTQSLILSQKWVKPMKPNAMLQNTLKYISVDPQLRTTSQVAWNRPQFWPLLLLLFIVILILIPAGFYYVYREHQPAMRIT